MTKEDVALRGIQEWYAAQCNGEWEHQFGVEIGTLDNPGWRASIDLTDTRYEDRWKDRQEIDRSDSDWVHVWVDSKRFQIACGPKNLTEAIALFLDWVDDDHNESSRK